MKLRHVLVAACVMTLPATLSAAGAADTVATPAGSSMSIIAHAASLPGAQTLTVAEMAETRGMVTAPTPELNLDLSGFIAPIDITTEEPFNLGIDTLLEPIFVIMPID